MREKYGEYGHMEKYDLSKYLFVKFSVETFGENFQFSARCVARIGKIGDEGMSYEERRFSCTTIERAHQSVALVGL